MTLRPLLYFSVALVVLSLLAWAGQQRGSGESPVLRSFGTPSLPAEPAAGPSPSQARAAGSTAPVPDAGWVRRTAAAAGLPEVAVAAYARAVLGIPSSCRLGWTTLAGIGWVESQHGTLGGRTLSADGRPSEPIVGPALNGAGPVAAIRATAAGARLHGDAQWDHAVGPLQFLPSTWATWGRDGDGDGGTDPQDLDDAAASAAAYLCATGQDLTTGPGWAAAVFAYNHSADYVRAVYSAAAAYGDRSRRPRATGPS